MGGIPQSFIGLFVLELLSNCMVMLGVDGYLQQITEGVLIVLDHRHGLLLQNAQARARVSAA